MSKRFHIHCDDKSTKSLKNIGLRAKAKAAIKIALGCCREEQYDRGYSTSVSMLQLLTIMPSILLKNERFIDIKSYITVVCVSFGDCCISK
ncbi:MAG: hypothetical protein MRY32_09430 [Rickettsiales bacterium]|nr:hypothetical protein [Rickettsiales bacterium]